MKCFSILQCYRMNGDCNITKKMYINEYIKCLFYRKTIGFLPFKKNSRDILGFSLF